MTGGVADGDGRAGLADADDAGAVGGDYGRRSGGRGGVGRADRRGGRDIAGGIALRDGQGFAIGLRGRERQGVGALRIDGGGAERLTGGVADGDGRAGLAGADDAGAVGGDGSRRCGGGGEVGGDEGDGGRNIARRVALHDGQRFAVTLRCGQRQGVVAIRIDGALADRLAIGVTDDHGRGGLAGTGDRGALRIDLGGGQRHGGGIDGVQFGGRRDIARRVRLGHDQHAATGLWGGERDRIAAIGGDDRAADRLAVRADDTHRRARLARSGHGRSIGGKNRRGRGRGRDIGGCERDGRRDIARGIALNDGQGTAIGLGRRQRQRVATLRADGCRAQHLSGGVADGDGRAGLAGAGDAGAVTADRRGGRDRRGDIGRGRRCGWRDIARGVALHDGDGLTIGLGRVDRNSEGAVGGDRAGADHRARAVRHADRRARLTRAANAGAVGRETGGGRCGRLDIGVWSAGLVAVVAPAARYRRDDPADPGHAQHGGQDEGRAAALLRRGCHQIVQIGDRRESPRAARRGMRQPLAALIVAQHQVADPALLLIVEIVDANGLAVGQADDQVIALALHRDNLRPIEVKPHDAGGVQFDDVGAGRGRGAGRLGDDLGLHGLFLPLHIDMPRRDVPGRGARSWPSSRHGAASPYADRNRENWPTMRRCHFRI